jgi:membrane associated rhomboid family serine protease
LSAPDAPETGVPTCYRHPGRETYIRCQRCDRPICPDCMRDAAVGFQCQNCVAEGAKATRSGRTAYGGERSANPQATSLVLVGLNLLVFALVFTTGGSQSVWLGRLAMHVEFFDWQLSDGAYVPVRGLADGAWWQFVTAMFTHYQPWHIGFNMLALWALGPMLETAIGRVRFIALYFLSGLAGSAMVYWFAPPLSFTFGASGAIFGLMAALLVIAIKVKGNVRSILGWIGLNFLITFVFVKYISWQGHLGGFLGGLAICAAIVYAPRNKRSVYQFLGMALVAAFVAVAIVVRSLQLA